jgi:Bacterial Ig domain
MLRQYWVGLALIAATTVPAFAEDTAPSGQRPANWLGAERVMVVSPPSSFTDTTAHATSPYIYVNRCTNNCQITYAGVDDARANQSGIPDPGAGCPGFPNCTVSEFRTADQKTGSNGKCRGGTAAGTDCTDATSSSVCTGGGDCYSADDEWSAVMQCMKEVYSPFGVQVSDTKPAGGVSFTMAILAGKASEIGLGPGILGIAPIAGDCSAKDNVISFSFANDHGATERVNNLCWTVAQETAHAFGLDHEFQFADGTSACNDPMTYRFDCGGQKFFRNKAASCGEDAIRPCMCGGSQNSHLKITGVFGGGTSLIPAPTVVVTSPAQNASVNNGAVVAVQAGSDRGVEKVELFLNGYKWAEAPGAMFRQNGQPNPSNYSLTFPGGVPDGVTDVVVVASDDIGGKTTAPTITVTKGAPCATAATCANGQRCEAGKCFWDPPVGVLGEACTFPQYCESNLCVETSAGGLCSQDCIVGASDACPMGYECQPFGNSGACIEAEEATGCCSVGTGGKDLWLHFGLSAAILGFMVRRRRKR